MRSTHAGWLVLSITALVLSHCSCIIGEKGPSDCDTDQECAVGSVCKVGHCTVDPSCADGHCTPDAGCADGHCASDAGCADGHCASDAGCDGGACIPITEAACDDGIDNDADGKTDCADDDCLGLKCSDGDGCTTGEICQSNHLCGSGTPLVCPAPPTACELGVGVCTSPSGTCSYSHALSGAACSDGDPNTGPDTCDGAGHCVPGPLKDCPDSPPCKTGGHLVSGVCQYVFHSGDACTGANQCLVSQVCQADGSCGGGVAKTCTAADQCHSVSCNPSSGCVQSLKTGSACVTSDQCVTNPVCQADGSCTGSPKSCPDQDQCHTGSCNPGTGCVQSPKVGSACVSGRQCFQSETCDGAGNCGGGVALTNTQWGSLPSQKCCGGVAVDISTNPSHCGGCNSPCATGVCESVAATNCCVSGNSAATCHPASTSGRCTCSSNLQCPRSQGCRLGQATFNNRCAPPVASDCASGHDVNLFSCPDYCSP